MSSDPSYAYSDYSQWATDEVGWELKKLTFRRNISDRGYPAEKGTHGQRMIRGLRLKSQFELSKSHTAGSPASQTVENVGQQSAADDLLEARIKNLMALPTQSGDCAARRKSEMPVGSKESY